MDVHAMHAAYGDYAIANTFSNNDSAEPLPDTEVPLYHAAHEVDPGAKRHAACDECRRRKLKCSGEKENCTRCRKHNLICHYSRQAQMGRPRKKRKTSEEADNVEPRPPFVPAEQPVRPAIPDYIQPVDRFGVEDLCPNPYTQYVRRRTPAPPPPFLTQASLYEQLDPLMDAGSNDSPPTESPPTPVVSQLHATLPEYPDDTAHWPDYSTMTMLPQIVQDNHPPRSTSFGNSQSVDIKDSTHALPATPSCPCLPNLYLTLSSLSTLSSFPISVHTIESLQTAHRTAQSVLYCPICPTKFQSGMQNVMLSGTLLTILADNWHRVRAATAEELRTGFSSPRANSLQEELPLTDLQSLEWRKFAYHLLRANVFGDKVTPCPPCVPPSTEHHPDIPPITDQPVQRCHHLASINSSASTPTLLSLIDAMDRRQSSWHGKIPDTGEFPERMSNTALQEHVRGLTLDQMKEVEMSETGHLCLRIVQGARSVLQTLNVAEPTSS